jgi:hypothetical protein
MRILAASLLFSAAVIGSPAMAQSQSSGASGYVQDQDKASTTGQPQNQPYRSDNATGDASTATSAQNSGAGISGAPGSKNGPNAQQGTVGSNSSVQQQDPAKVQGMPGGKSGQPVKH